MLLILFLMLYAQLLVQFGSKSGLLMLILLKTQDSLMLLRLTLLLMLLKLLL